MTRQMRSSIRAASGPEQGVGSLPSMPRSPSITTSPEKRRPDPLPLPVSTIVPSKQKGQSPILTNRQSACCISGLGVVFCSFFFCQGIRMECQSPLVSLLCAWSRAPDLPGGHKCQKRASKKQGTDPGVTNPQTPTASGGTVGSAFPPTPVLCPPSGHRLSTSGLC